MTAQADVRKSAPVDEGKEVNEQHRFDREGIDAFVDAVDRAIPELYAYLFRRCGVRALAEDLTSETVLAAVRHVHAGNAGAFETAYLIGIARHKLVDHWRRQERERRHLTALSGGDDEAATDVVFQPGYASEVLATLNPMQRAALTLRYVDDLSVAEVARLLGRSVHATETLLVRAKRVFRSRYSSIEQGLST